ncbi:MAG: AAA family ATPase, partial [Candidatus Nanohaloarchaeota archaeon QJJ-9]|nr:AAA family ATPase [Candidatus Nanohaloarchaeota archaeon QJJ-9]
MVERIPTGMDGLDELIEGGFPEKSVNLVAGGPGTGKTIFCSQFLWKGLQEGDNCLFITMEEDSDEILEDAKEFGWDFGEYEEEGSFEIEFVNPFQIGEGLKEHIVELVNKMDADRVVIDSISVMGMYTQGAAEVRRRLYELIKHLRRKEVTTVITSEAPKGEEDSISRFGVEEFVSDTVVTLHYMGIGGGIFRNIEVPKIRKTD